MRTLLHRWVRFNAIGIIGAGVQLVCLHSLSKFLGSHYLWAAAVALELTLLHNFCWLSRFSWTAAVSRWERLRQLYRFHFANGVVSLSGNLALMGWLVGKKHLGPVAANAIAIAVCSVINFLLSERWVFPAPMQR